MRTNRRPIGIGAIRFWVEEVGMSDLTHLPPASEAELRQRLKDAGVGLE